MDRDATPGQVALAWMLAQHPSFVPIPGTRRDHTDPVSTGFFDVMVGGRDNAVRTRLRRSDLYLVGWFTGNDTYNYIGPRDQAGIPDTHNHPATPGQRGGSWQLARVASYGRLEGMAGAHRANLRWPVPRPAWIGWSASRI
ncbi:hypothetical protein TUSST3_40600 [Streptomyces sp. TUS-ST3]|uniref:hypothetical protein n=1 Tax=Streptomyces sp. TUS-ST3 TaxID=3025591 RepID=UPI00235B3AFB|nr:hypothetical protein [Streptomyces sp. TUS-ST3]GLP67438.1 hypothetical protein TUSST3_40600 [Streptomyces sp. TUS-ST3]